MQKSTWTAPTFEEIEMGSDDVRDDVDEASQLLGRDTHVRLRSDERWGLHSQPPREDR